jgi:pimeloyl-ACP methyl ester carboxylesterase
MSTPLIPTPRSQALLLPSGRHMGIAEQGDPQGVPVLFFHGFVGSRLQCPPDGTVPASVGVRLLAVDRPGIGLSDRVPGRRLLAWAADIKMVTEVLHLPRFAILGWSAGAPHALACACLIPERVAAIGLASPMGGWFVGPGATRQVSPEARGLTTLVRLAPWALRPAFKLLQWRIAHNPGRLVEEQLRHLPPTDQATLADPPMRRMLIETLGEAFRGGVGGVYDDTLAVARPRGFAPEAITTPAWLWQGDADTTVLPGLAEELARKLPQCQATLLSGEGHFLVFTHWRTMLQTLAQALQVAPAKPASGTEHSFGT